MERKEALEAITEIGKDVFDEPNLVITEETTAADVDGWDSLTHLSLIDELEEKYNISFSLAEVTGSKNVGELVTALIKHVEEGK